MSIRLLESLRTLSAAVSFLFAVSLLSLSAGEAPELGKVKAIHITSGLPVHDGFLCYEFTMTINQGDRFQFIVAPVAGAKVNTEVVVFTPNQRNPKRPKRFESSGVHNAQNWTMSNKPPGTELVVRIRANVPAELKVTVLKVKPRNPEGE